MDEPPDALISLRAAAEELSVHYMTAYRYVRTGRLPAVKEGTEWRVRRSDLVHLMTGATPGAVPASTGGDAPRSRFRSRLRDRLLAADEGGAWRVVEAALTSGATPEEVYLGLLMPVMRSIGDGWARGELTVHDEHRATAVATRLVGRLGPQFRRPGRRRGVVVLGAVSGDTHGLATALLADLVRARGFEVIDLGADTPPESFVDATRSEAISALALTCSHRDALPTVGATVHTVRRSGYVGPILVGGGGVEPADVEALGADAGGRTAEEALDLIERLGGSAGRRLHG